MKLTSRLIDNLRKIMQGDSIPYSSLPKSLVDSLVSEGLLNVEYHRSRRSLRTHNAAALAEALPQYNEALCDLDVAASLLAGDKSRALQASLSGNSKVRNERSCPGFLANSFTRLDCTLNGKELILYPQEGSAIYIADWQAFLPPADALVIGVENMENFLKIREQKKLFHSCLNEDEKGILFVARYAFSSDLTHWLRLIPNRYVHFGDFDLAGINIFLTQFKPAVGDRGSFLIPADIEQRLSRGSRQRYDDQFLTYQWLTTNEPDLNRLIDMINRYRRAYDQEGYIEV